MGYYRSGLAARPNARERDSFLRFHGYLEPNDTPLAAVEAFQRLHGCPVTGKMNWATVGALRAPRCAQPELAIAPAETIRRFEASSFAAQAPRLISSGGSATPVVAVTTAPPGYQATHFRWSRRTVSYAFVGGFPSNLGDAARDIVRDAFAAWNALEIVTFAESPTPTNADIRILWTYGPTGTPGISDPFFGPGDKVAVAYYPIPDPRIGELAGDLHFDAHETWSASGANGLDLGHVALHEIGHCVGLGHCFGSPSVMAPTYTMATRSIKAIDIEALRTKYLGVEP